MRQKMTESLGDLGIFRKLTWQDVLLVLAVLLLAHMLAVLVRSALRNLAEKVPSRRLAILRLTPILRLVVRIGAAFVIVPILIEPTFQNVIALVASVGLALAFAFKDYGSSLVAGLVTVLENTYQPGDWIEVDGAYGEVKSINARALHLVTPDDTEVIVPHSRLWSTSVFNATSGNRSLLCVANFYLHPDHDAAAVRRRLAEVANSSTFRKPETSVVVIALEKPWGTHYRVKAYVKESREQFLFTTDLTIRGKEALRNMEVRFAQAPYAETETSFA
jgi:small-conductance mechanosensitive channel